MPDGLLISRENYVDNPATLITASDEASLDYVASNVATSLAFKKWRVVFLSETTAFIQFDFQEPKLCKCFGILFPRRADPNVHNKTPWYAPTDQIRIRLSNVQAGDGEVWDSGWMDSGVLLNFGYFAMWLENGGYTAQYCQIDFDCPGRASDGVNPDLGWLDVKRIWVGDYYETSVFFTYGANTKRRSNSRSSQPINGTTRFVSPQPSFSTWTFTLDSVDETEPEEGISEADWLDDMESYLTTAGEFFVHRYDKARGRGDMFCYNQDNSGANHASFMRSTRAYILVENA
jgi:hypothetical protein